MFNPYFFEKEAQMRQKEWLRAARVRQLIREIQGERPRLWQQLAWEVGDLMIVFGHRLKAGQKPIWSETHHLRAAQKRLAKPAAEGQSGSDGDKMP